MENSTNNSNNASENQESVGKVVAGPNHSGYNPPAPTNSVSIANDSGQPAIQHPPAPHSQTHGYISRIGTQPYNHLHFKPPNVGPAPDMMQRGASSTSEELGPVSGSPTATTMAAQGIIGHEHDDADGRKGAKRELSQSKRAAQNRAAQRAFRQRKEHYIKKLEQQVREYGEMEHSWKTIQNDNYALREYVIQLQSRLLDLQVELPQPPPNVNITPPNALGTARQPHATAPVELRANAPNDAGTLADVAAAVAGLNRETATEGNYGKSTFKSENTMPQHHGEDVRRQMPTATLPPPSSLRT